MSLNTIVSSVFPLSTRSFTSSRSLDLTSSDPFALSFHPLSSLRSTNPLEPLPVRCKDHVQSRRVEEEIKELNRLLVDEEGGEDRMERPRL